MTTRAARHVGDPIPHGTEGRYRRGCRCKACEIAVARASEGRRDAELLARGIKERTHGGRNLVMNYTPPTRLGPLEPHSDRMLIKHLWSELRKTQIEHEDAEGGTVFST